MPPLLAAVLRCNQYDPDEYMPVVVATDGAGAMEQVGWATPTLLEALAPQLAAGKTCALVELRRRRGEFWLASAPGAPGGGAGAGGFGGGALGTLAEPTEVYQRPYVGVQLAPEVDGPFARTEVATVMVEELVLDGLIPAAKVRPRALAWRAC